MHGESTRLGRAHAWVVQPFPSLHQLLLVDLSIVSPVDKLVRIFIVKGASFLFYSKLLGRTDTTLSTCQSTLSVPHTSNRTTFYQSSAERLLRTSAPPRDRQSWQPATSWRAVRQRTCGLFGRITRHRHRRTQPTAEGVIASPGVEEHY